MNHEAMDLIMSPLLDLVKKHKWEHDINPDGSYSIFVTHMYQTHELLVYVDEYWFMHIEAVHELSVQGANARHKARTRLQLYTLINTINGIETMCGAFSLDEERGYLRYKLQQLITDTSEETDVAVFEKLFFSTVMLFDAYVVAFVAVNDNNTHPETALVHAELSSCIPQTKH